VGFKEGGVDVDFEKSAVMLEDYSRWLREYAVTDQILLLDFGTAPLLSNPDMFLDGIHPNSKGNQIMAEICITFLEKWEQTRSR
jgi:lysophospholipase L1-like esterase